MNEKGWNVMKRKIAKGLMAASVLICCLFLVKEVFAGRFFPLYETEAESASIPPRAVNSLSVSSEQTDVKIIAEARNDIAANMTGPAGKMFVQNRGKILNLKAKEKGFQFLNLFQRPLLIVRIPYDYHRDITVHTSSGSIAVDGNKGLSLAHLGVRSVSGNMSLKHVKTEVFEAKGLSGNLTAAGLAAKTGMSAYPRDMSGFNMWRGPLTCGSLPAVSTPRLRRRMLPYPSGLRAAAQRLPCRKTEVLR